MTSSDIHTDVWDIVYDIKDKIDHIMADMYDPSNTITLDTKYQVLLQDLVYQMTSLAVNREENFLDPLTNPLEIKEAVDCIVGSIVSAFSVSRQQIEADMKPYLGKYSGDDIRTARILRKANKLN